LRGARAAWHTPQHWLYGWVEGVAEDRPPSDAPAVVSAARQWLPHLRQQASPVLKSSRPATWTVEWLRRAARVAERLGPPHPQPKLLAHAPGCVPCQCMCWHQHVLGCVGPWANTAGGGPAVCFMMVHARHAWHRTHGTQSMHPCSCLPAHAAHAASMHPVGAH
jgi:hypothetical protein